MEIAITFIKNLWHDEDGLTTVEYAVAGGLITAAVIAAFQALGGNISRIIQGISDALTNVPTP